MPQPAPRGFHGRRNRNRRESQTRRTRGGDRSESGRDEAARRPDARGKDAVGGGARAVRPHTRATASRSRLAATTTRHCVRIRHFRAICGIPTLFTRIHFESLPPECSPGFAATDVARETFASPLPSVTPADRNAHLQCNKRGLAYAMQWNDWQN